MRAPIDTTTKEDLGVSADSYPRAGTSGSPTRRETVWLEPDTGGQPRPLKMLEAFGWTAPAGTRANCSEISAFLGQASVRPPENIGDQSGDAAIAFFNVLTFTPGCAALRLAEPSVLHNSSFFGADPGHHLGGYPEWVHGPMASRIN